MKMKRIVSIVLVIIFCITMMCSLSGCRKSNRVNYNISEQADNFQIYRRITVINTRDNSLLYELEAFFALSNSNENELIVTSQIGSDSFKKDYIYLNTYTTYVVEQLEAEDVSPYHYEFIIYPKMIDVAQVNIQTD